MCGDKRNLIPLQLAVNCHSVRLAFASALLGLSRWEGYLVGQHVFPVFLDDGDDAVVRFEQLLDGLAAGQTDFPRRVHHDGDVALPYFHRKLDGFAACVRVVRGRGVLYHDVFVQFAQQDVVASDTDICVEEDCFAHKLTDVDVDTDVLIDHGHRKGSIFDHAAASDLEIAVAVNGDVFFAASVLDAQCPCPLNCLLLAVIVAGKRQELDALVILQLVHEVIADRI